MRALHKKTLLEDCLLIVFSDCVLLAAGRTTPVAVLASLGKQSMCLLLGWLVLLTWSGGSVIASFDLGVTEVEEDNQLAWSEDEGDGAAAASASGPAAPVRERSKTTSNLFKRSRVSRL